MCGLNYHVYFGEIFQYTSNQCTCMYQSTSVHTYVPVTSVAYCSITANGGRRRTSRRFNSGRACDSGDAAAGRAARAAGPQLERWKLVNKTEESIDCRAPSAATSTELLWMRRPRRPGLTPPGITRGRCRRAHFDDVTTSKGK